MTNNFSKKNFIPEILIILFPIALISGPLIPELFILTINLFFIYNLIQKKEINLFQNKIFYLLIFFISYVTFLSYISNYSDQIFIKNIFYFRFLLFVFSIYYFLNENPKILKLIFYSLLIMFLVLIIDGFYQFFNGKNLIGIPKYRSDRISSFFEDKLVLGSFISRYFFIFIGLFFIFKNKLNTFPILILICFAFILILLTGERSALFLTIIGLFILFILLEFSLKFKFIILLSAISILIISLNLNSTLYDRYISQTKSQISLDKDINIDNFFDRFKYYQLSWKTAYNGYKDNKFFGQGPKAFKYFCANPKLAVYQKKKSVIYNNVQYLVIHKKFINVEITELFFKVGDVVEKNQLLLKYKFKNKEYKFYSDKIGVIEHVTINKNQFVNTGHSIFVLDLSGYDIPEKTYFYKNGCTTHPHQLYLQLMSETGIIGASYIFLIFLFISFLLIKHFIMKLFKRKTLYNNTKICLLTYFFLLLFPMTTFGNFFNNWFIMSFSLQLGLLIYFFIDYKNKKYKNSK